MAKRVEATVRKRVEEAMQTQEVQLRTEVRLREERAKLQASTHRNVFTRPETNMHPYTSRHGLAVDTWFTLQPLHSCVLDCYSPSITTPDFAVLPWEAALSKFASPPWIARLCNASRQTCALQVQAVTPPPPPSPFFISNIIKLRGIDDVTLCCHVSVRITYMHASCLPTPGQMATLPNMQQPQEKVPCHSCEIRWAVI